jgi:hypothetical protein
VGLVTIAGTSPANREYVGSIACRECHPGEHAMHTGSGHARTLRRAGEIPQASRLDGLDIEDPEQPETRWRYHARDDQIVAERIEGRGVERFVLEFAVGSGQHAITFVTLEPKSSGPPTALEHRLTYFTASDSLGLTPGQNDASRSGKTSGGFHLPPAVALDCLECHGTPTAPPRGGGLDPATLLPNVTCERCHGPGRSHVEAARAGVGDPILLAMPFGPGRNTGLDQMGLCGRCHRLPEMVPLATIRVDNPSLARFPSVGLVQSACFQESRGLLTCTTCHNAHRRVSTDRVVYDNICLSCHPTPASRPSQPRTEARSCPVNPSADCVSCHMPKRDVGHGLRFSDHWIRAQILQDAP